MCKPNFVLTCFPNEKGLKGHNTQYSGHTDQNFSDRKNNRNTTSQAN